MTTVAVIQARTGSSRLPGKVLLPLAGAPALQRMVERVRQAHRLDGIVIATSTAPGDDAVVSLCDAIGVDCVRGPEDDVLARFALVASTVASHAERLVRLTGDCPLVAPDLVDALVETAIDGSYDYVSNVDPPSWPDGLDVEVCTREVLLEAAATAVLPSDREHVTPWVRRMSKRQHTSCAPSPRDLSHLRWTLDEPEDYVLIAAVYSALHERDEHFTTADILRYLETRPEIMAINQRFARNEGYRKSLTADAAAAPHDADRG